VIDEIVAAEPAIFSTPAESVQTAGLSAGSASKRRASASPWLRYVIALAIVAGIFFRCYHIDRKTYWEDELLGTIHALGYTEAEIVAASPRLRDAGAVQTYFRLPATPGTGTLGVASTVRSLALEDPQHPPLFYVLSHLWAGVFGSSVAAMRALPALFGVVALVAMYGLAFELFASRPIAWLSVALLAISPFQVLYSQEAREYTLWSVMILVSSTLVLRAARTGAARDWLAYAASLILSLYVFPLSALVICGHAVYLVVCGAFGKGRSALWFLGACALATLAFAPWIRIMLASGGLGRGMNGILATKMGLAAVLFACVRDLKSGLFDFGFFTVGPFHSSAINALSIAVAVALLGYAGYALARSGRSKAATFVLLGLTFPALALAAHDVVFGGDLVGQARYLMPALLAAVLALANLFDDKLRAARGLWPATFVCVLLGAVASCVISAEARTWWNKDYERTPQVAAIVNAAQRPLVVSDQASSRALALSFYLRPDVALRLHLRCVQCTAELSAEPDLLAQSGRFSDIFLVGPYGGPGTLPPDQFRVIGIGTFPSEPNPLNMFLSIR